MAGLIEVLAKTAGLSDAKAEMLALSAMNAVRREFGGRTFYVKKWCEHPSELGAELYARMERGERVRDIARDIDKTAAYVYRLICAERKRLKALREQRK